MIKLDHKILFIKRKQLDHQRSPGNSLDLNHRPQLSTTNEKDLLHNYKIKEGPPSPDFLAFL